MPRVLVCGCSGSGKSTFAGRLGPMLGLKPIGLDAHYWQPGWVESDHAGFRARMEPLIAEENWIIDGNYFSALGELHLLRATHVFYFDLARWRCMKGVLGRMIRGYGSTRAEMAAGCPERFDPAFLRYVWTYRAKQRSRTMQRLEGLRPDQDLTIFRSRSDADTTLKTIAIHGLS